MRKFRMVSACLLLVAAAGVQAQLRTYMSVTGNDANPCSEALPCRTLSATLLKTPDHAEILALDSVGYANGGGAPIVITQSVTIDGNGTRASLAAPGTLGHPGIVINDSGGNSIVVTIRNFAINGLGTGVDAIRFQSGKRLMLDNVTIMGFTGKAIAVTTGPRAHLTLSNVLIEDIGGLGIHVQPTSGPVYVNGKNVRVAESLTTSAVFLNGNVHAAFVDSEFVNSPNGAGITIAGAARVNLDRVTATGNGWGVWNFSGTPVTRLKDCMLVSNTNFGALVSAGSITAYESNVIENPSGVTSTPPM